MNVRLFLMLVQFAISSLFSFRFPLESNRENFNLDEELLDAHQFPHREEKGSENES